MRPETLVVFDGQSLNNIPSTTSMPAVAMAGSVRPWCNAAISGASWTVLAATQATRLNLLPGSYRRAILVLTGGYADIVGEGNTGAQAYADQQAYATSARTVGFDRIIATTMTHGTTTTSPQLAAINVYNALVLADVAHDWDAKVDLAAIPQLADPSNATYFSDGLHWTAVGAALAGAALAPIIAALE